MAGSLLNLSNTLGTLYVPGPGVSFISISNNQPEYLTSCDIASASKSKGYCSILALLSEDMIGMISVWWWIVSSCSINRLYSAFESELQRVQPNLSFLVIGTRSWSFWNWGRVLAAFNVYLGIGRVRETERLTLVTSQCIKLPSELITVGRRRVNALSHDQPILLSKAKTCVFSGFQCGRQGLHLSIVINSNLKGVWISKLYFEEPILFWEGPSWVTIAQSVWGQHLGKPTRIYA